MAKRFLLLILVCAACQSVQDSKRSRTPQQVGKVTNGPTIPPPQVFIQIEYCPRREQEFQLSVLNNESVRICFMAHFAATQAATSITIEGQIDYPGMLHDIQAEGSSEELRECLKTAMVKVKLGRGKIGAFKMAIATGPELLKGAKGMVIMPPETKKFE